MNFLFTTEMVLSDKLIIKGIKNGYPQLCDNSLKRHCAISTGHRLG